MFEIGFLVMIVFNSIYLAENTHQEDKDATALIYKDEEWDLNTGHYNYGFKTSNGILREESGIVSGIGELEVRGSYSFTSPEGKTYTVIFSSGKDGYQARVTEDVSSAASIETRISGKLLESLGG